MNPQDPNLNGEGAETPIASPAETITPDEGTSVNPQGAATPSPEEERWNNLSGAAQERFRQVTRENNALRQRLETPVQTQNYPQIPVNGADSKTPEVEAAVRRLSQVGIATKDEVNSVVDQKLAGLIYNQEIVRLESKFSGDNGLPKFDRDEYNDYVARHPQFRNYAPEDVYEKMYSPEILDWKMQNAGKSPTSARAANSSLKPTRTQVREEPITPESIETRLQQPDGRQWYESHRDQIQTVLQKNAGPSAW